MDTKPILCTVLLSILTLVFLGCPKECVTPERSYVAEFTIDHQKSYIVGDTIWFYSEMDCTNMYNSFTNTYDKFCGQTFNSTIFLGQMVDSLRPLAGPGLESFDFVVITGDVYNDSNVPSSDRVNQMRYAQKGNSYIIHFGLVCKNTGSFIVGLPKGGSFGSDHCDRSSLDIKILNENRNLRLYEDYIYPNFDSEYGMRNFYVFEVQ